MWGKHFDETSASIFVTSLRNKGIRVQLVGLGGTSASGYHGLTLTSDASLREVAQDVNSAVCVILPCEMAYVRPFEDDPRLQQFMDTANDNHAYILIPHTQKSDQSKLLAKTNGNLYRYPSREQLVSYAQTFAQDLHNQFLQTDTS
ncbi:MAG: hypothetical protein AAF639_26630 [Chloroflexota bacterium]